MRLLLLALAVLGAETWGIVAGRMGVTPVPAPVVQADVPVVGVTNLMDPPADWDVPFNEQTARVDTPCQ
jgi:hypothetical protein